MAQGFEREVFYVDDRGYLEMDDRAFHALVAQSPGRVLQVTGIESARRTPSRPPWLGKDSGISAEALHTLFEEGVPEHFIGRMFRLDEEPAMTRSTRGPVLRFGTTGLSAAVGVEVDTGHVVEVLDIPDPPVLFINTSLASFVDTLEAVAQRFPFYDSDDDEDEVGSTSDDVLRIVRRIDPPAAEPDRYWSTFVDDMRIGDLTTEAILEAVDQT